MLNMKMMLSREYLNSIYTSIKSYDVVMMRQKVLNMCIAQEMSF